MQRIELAKRVLLRTSHIGHVHCGKHNAICPRPLFNSSRISLQAVGTGVEKSSLCPLLPPRRGHLAIFGRNISTPKLRTSSHPGGIFLTRVFQILIVELLRQCNSIQEEKSNYAFGFQSRLGVGGVKHFRQVRFVRYNPELKRTVPARYPIPPAPALADFEEFLTESPEQYRITWR